MAVYQSDLQAISFASRCFYVRSSNAPANQVDTGHRTEIQRAIMTGKAPEIEKPYHNTTSGSFEFSRASTSIAISTDNK